MQYLLGPIQTIIYYPFNFQACHKSEYCPGPSVTGPRRKRSQYWPWICAPGNTGMASHLGRRLMQMRNQYWPRAILQYCPRAILILEKRYIMLWRKHSAVALLVQSSKSTPLSVTESTAARMKMPLLKSILPCQRKENERPFSKGGFKVFLEQIWHQHPAAVRE